MEKEQIAEKLTGMGYKSVLENGVIMCAVNNRKDAREVENALTDLSYHGSWGYQIKGGADEAEAIHSGGDTNEVQDSRNAERNVVLPHEGISEHSSVREHREQAESEESVSDDESVIGGGKINAVEWKDCATIFSNGTEFEIFQWQCEKCTRYRNGKCRIFSRIVEAMFDQSIFPYDDLMDAVGYGGKKCKSFTDEPIKRNRAHKAVDGQMSLTDLL